jgi:hypothetical protein
VIIFLSIVLHLLATTGQFPLVRNRTVELLAGINVGKILFGFA